MGIFKLKSLLFMVSILFVWPTAAVLADSVTPEYGATLQWDSKYVSEGRDNLHDGGLLSLELVASWDSISAGVWFADSTSTSHEEFNYFIEYGFDLGTAIA